MTRKHEELVGELLKEECSTCKDHFKREDCLSGQENYCGVRMEKMLALFLFAVRDGLPLLGEVGRREWNEDMMVMPNGEMWGISKGSILIALHEEEEK